MKTSLLDELYCETFCSKGYVVKIADKGNMVYFGGWKSNGLPNVVLSRKKAYRFLIYTEATRTMKWIPVMCDREFQSIGRAKIAVEKIDITVQEAMFAKKRRHVL